MNEQDNALALWRELVEAGIDPVVESHQGNLYCFFCGEGQVSTKEAMHFPDCIYVRAKKLLEK